MEQKTVKSKDFGKYSAELDERGFLWIRHKSNLTFELEDAQLQEKDLIEFCGGHSLPFLVDVRVQNWDAPKEVREFHATSLPLLELKKAEAILVNSLGLRILANFYSRFNRPLNPSKVFTNEDEAIEWVLEYV